MLEKHFTHDKSLPGNDHYHAMDMQDLKLFFRRMDTVYELLGVQSKGPLESEEISRQNARRSLVAKTAILKGEVITRDHLTWKRPASGISPRQIAQVVGKTAAEEIQEDMVLSWQMIR